MDDCITLILQKACRERVNGLATPLAGMDGVGEFRGSRTFISDLSPIMRCSGFKRGEATILLADTVVPIRKKKRYTELTRHSDLSVGTGYAENYSLLVKDLDWYHQDSGFYEQEEIRFHPPRASHVCLAYGRRDRRTYSLCLNKALRATIEVDVEIVPTAWRHPEDAEGSFWVLQIISDEDDEDWDPTLSTPFISDRVILAGWSSL